MPDITTELQARNQQIGRLLSDARGRKHVPVAKCAELIGTSRRRYAAMEKGVATIGVAELEVLIDFLEIPPHEVWGTLESPVDAQQLIVQAQPGKKIQITVSVQE